MAKPSSNLLEFEADVAGTPEYKKKFTLCDILRLSQAPLHDSLNFFTVKTWREIVYSLQPGPIRDEKDRSRYYFGIQILRPLLEYPDRLEQPIRDLLSRATLTDDIGRINLHEKSVPKRYFPLVKNVRCSSESSDDSESSRSSNSNDDAVDTKSKNSFNKIRSSDIQKIIMFTPELPLRSPTYGFRDMCETILTAAFTRASDEIVLSLLDRKEVREYFLKIGGYGSKDSNLSPTSYREYRDGENNHVQVITGIFRSAVRYAAPKICIKVLDLIEGHLRLVEQCYGLNLDADSMLKRTSRRKSRSTTSSTYNISVKIRNSTDTHSDSGSFGKSTQSSISDVFDANCINFIVKDPRTELYRTALSHLIERGKEQDDDKNVVKHELGKKIMGLEKGKNPELSEILKSIQIKVTDGCSSGACSSPSYNGEYPPTTKQDNIFDSDYFQDKVSEQVCALWVQRTRKQEFAKVILKLLDSAYFAPDVLHHRDQNGTNCFHLACQYSTPEVCMSILKHKYLISQIKSSSVYPNSDKSSESTKSTFLNQNSYRAGTCLDFAIHYMPPKVAIQILKDESTSNCIDSRTLAGCTHQQGGGGTGGPLYAACALNCSKSPICYNKVSSITKGTFNGSNSYDEKQQRNELEFLILNHHAFSEKCLLGLKESSSSDSTPRDSGMCVVELVTLRAMGAIRKFIKRAYKKNSDNLICFGNQGADLSFLEICELHEVKFLHALLHNKSLKDYHLFHRVKKRNILELIVELTKQIIVKPNTNPSVFARSIDLEISILTLTFRYTGLRIAERMASIEKSVKCNELLANTYKYVQKYQKKISEYDFPTSKTTKGIIDLQEVIQKISDVMKPVNLQPFDKQIRREILPLVSDSTTCTSSSNIIMTSNKSAITEDPWNIMIHKDRNPH